MIYVRNTVGVTLEDVLNGSGDDNTMAIRGYVGAKLMPYVAWAAEWWKTYEDCFFETTGTYSTDGPVGLCLRFTSSGFHSPIKGVQTFPFVKTTYLQMPQTKGGYKQFIAKMFLNSVTFDDMTVICKDNSPTTADHSQFLAFVPTDILATIDVGRWMYISVAEQLSICKGTIPYSLKHRVRRLLNENETPIEDPRQQHFAFGDEETTDEPTV